MDSDLICESWDDYEYLDSGHHHRLERFGSFVFRRPAPVAIWSPARSRELWRQAHATYVRDSKGGGRWDFHSRVPDRWEIAWEDVRFVLKPTGFGHLGVFAEQAPNWRWIVERVRSAGRPIRLLNLFGYTGGTTLAAAAAGAEVVHVDAVKGVVNWASENARASGLDGASIRWIVDDAVKFVKREERRGSRYDAIVLDPPTFGRGSQGQVFKLERDLDDLMQRCRNLLSDDPLLLLLTCHTPGVGAAVLRNVLHAWGGGLTCGDALQVGPSAPLPLPAGVFARWEPTETQVAPGK